MAVEWSDEGTSGWSLSDCETLSIMICTGPNNDINCFDYLLESVQYSAYEASMSYSYVIDPSLGTNGPYFLQFSGFLTDSPDEPFIAYSGRFQLTGMTGASPVADDGGFLTSPPGQDPVDGNAPAATETAGPYTIPYPQQTTGMAKYATMQRLPGHSVTGTNTSPLFPTSSYSLFKSKAKAASFVTTYTMSRTYTPLMGANWAPPGGNPAENGGSHGPTQGARMRRRWDDEF
ncbi:hypothetical protein CANCADRAFT_45057 [Tortispora caseinolytica NRRL Y-17796]|uniref:Uncharacterized protein n=1 Tax=Tortispora caseinolytica NRRL Y-17796 TaxID=767744 RepID=A0A1E4TA08_9ASCO|nr:hypothetical protein CANCADRAFT_45057 [Tortispora caseinolytica NRRL Y-17796]